MEPRDTQMVTAQPHFHVGLKAVVCDWPHSVQCEPTGEMALLAGWEMTGSIEDSVETKPKHSWVEKHSTELMKHVSRCQNSNHTTFSLLPSFFFTFRQNKQKNLGKKILPEIHTFLRS